MMDYKKEEKQIRNQINELTVNISNDSHNTKLLHERAGLFTKIQDHGNAINDYIAIIGINPDDDVARVKLDMLKTISRFTNTDIYANPNTNLDPWLE
jgi:hypothetical protein